MKYISKVKKIFSKSSFGLVKFLLKVLEKLDARLYMRLYIYSLKKLGLKLTGVPRYISLNVRFDDFDLIELGERVVISDNVVFLTHDYSLTTALISINKAPKTDMAFLKTIKIGNNVFIGMGSFISPGSVVGDNVIIGASTVVRGRIPDNSIVIGNPGVVVGDLTHKADKWLKTLNNVNYKFRID